MNGIRALHIFFVFAELADKNPEAFGEHLRAEPIKWAKVVKAAGIKVE